MLKQQMGRVGDHQFIILILEEEYAFMMHHRSKQGEEQGETWGVI